jgi:hypothetical protein
MRQEELICMSTKWFMDTRQELISIIQYLPKYIAINSVGISMQVVWNEYLLDLNSIIIFHVNLIKK